MLLTKVAVHRDGWARRLRQPGRSDGVILVGQGFEHAAINEAARAGLPLAVWGAPLPNRKYPVAGSDNRLGGRLATAHLAERGPQAHRLPRRRTPAGHRQALRDAGLKTAPERLVRTGPTAAEAEARMREAIASGLAFDGVVAASDVIAIAAMRALAAACRRTCRWSASTTSCWPSTHIRR